MKKYINYFLLFVVAAIGGLLTACNDDDTNMSRAVLASVSVLEYDVTPDGPQIISVVSDGDWVVEAPEWVIVSPASGHVGVTEVEINVSDNLRDGTADNPRKATVLFKGFNMEGTASVIVRQDGDKFRDPLDFSIDAMEQAQDETIVRLVNMIVTAKTSNGFIATDGSGYVYVKEPASAVEVGRKVTIVGEKYFDENKMSYVIGGKITDEGSASIPSVEPFDISATLDQTNGKKYQYVSVSGTYDGSSITVQGMTNKVYLIDPDEELNISQYSGHKVNVTGYFAGMASPVVNLIPVEIVDNGLNEIIYFFEDFEWLEPWAAAGNDGGANPAADIVGTNQANTEQPQITSAKCVIDGRTPADELADRGYEFLRNWAPAKESDKSHECIYIQRNYLKFGKTGYQGGVILPKMPDLGDGVEDVTLSFDWYTQRQGSGVLDPTELVVIVNDGSESVFNVPLLGLEEGSAAKWVRATIPLTGLKLTKDARITIRNTDEQLGSGKALRWHMDNVKVSKPL